MLKHFLPLLSKDRAIYAKLYARAGSNSDNQNGDGGYHASGAAFNMMLQTARTWRRAPWNRLVLHPKAAEFRQRFLVRLFVAEHYIFRLDRGIET